MCKLKIKALNRASATESNCYNLHKCVRSQLKSEIWMAKIKNEKTLCILLGPVWSIADPALLIVSRQALPSFLNVNGEFYFYTIYGIFSNCKRSCIAFQLKNQKEIPKIWSQSKINKLGSVSTCNSRERREREMYYVAEKCKATFYVRTFIRIKLTLSKQMVNCMHAWSSF